MCNFLETDPATRVNCGSIRFITLWYCGRCHMVASCGACRGRGSKERVAKWVLGAIEKRFPVRFPLWAFRGWWWKRWGYRSTVRYSKSWEICRNGGNVAEKWQKVRGGVCIKACRAWKWGWWRAGVIGWYRTCKIWGLWAWLKRGTCTEVNWSACNLSWGWLASLYGKVMLGTRWDYINLKCSPIAKQQIVSIFMAFCVPPPTAPKKTP